MSSNDCDNEDFEEFGGDGVDFSNLFRTTVLFDTADNAIEWCRNVAHSVGFTLVQNSQKHRGGLQYNTIMCDRGGKYRSRSRDPNGPKRKNTSTKKCQCPFKLIIKEGSRNGGFGIFPKIGTHNHQLIKYKEGHRQMARLTLEKKNYVRQQYEAQVKPSAISCGLEKTFGDGVEPVIRQIYNFTAQTRKDKRKGLNHAQHMLAMAKQYKYTFSLEKDCETNELTHIIMCHPEGLRLLRSYPYVLIIDSTYKTNMYNMPFVEVVGITPVGKTFLIAYAIMLDETTESYVWLLQKLRLLFDEGVVPNAIVTDREQGLGAAIRSVFPDTNHLLCVWHIEKNVETTVKMKLQDGDEADKFISKKWKPLMYSNTLERYYRNIDILCNTDRQDIVSYVKTTWLVHDRKFVRCFTDQVLHFGTTTTSRVESAHAVLKDWLKSSSLALDTIWERVDAALGRQHVEIYKLLESSRGKHCHDSHRGLFSLLNGFASHKAINLMRKELDRGIELGEALVNKCGCSIYTSQGLLCACRLMVLFQVHEKVFPKDIHIFWRTLVIDDTITVASNDIDLFHSFCVEVINSHPSVFRSATMALSSLLHPEHEDLENPAIKETFKGRPRIARRSNTRNRSGHEHASRRFPSSGPSSQVPASSSGPSSQVPASSSCPSSQVPENSTTTVDTFSSDNRGPSDIVELEPSNFPYLSYLPACIVSYLCGWYNPKPDSHCGFRAISHAVHGDEEHWMEMRRDLLKEIARAEYKIVYGEIKYDAKEPHARIEFEQNISCDQENWMETSDLFGYATTRCWVICVVGHRFFNDRHCWDGSYTILPLRVEHGILSPLAMIWLLNTGDHYLRIKIKNDPDTPSPMPPLDLYWRMAKDNTVDGWDNLFHSRIAKWKTIENNEPRHNSTIDDPQILE